MERRYLSHLKEWLDAPRRKPLVLRGARQVGKTWLVRKLAEQSGKLLIELNFEKNIKLTELLASNDVEETKQILETYINRSIVPSETLLFLDEIQVAPNLLEKLRWFAEDLPELAVIAAGSLLDFALQKHNFSMPVGRISYMYLQPLNFEEFLCATDRQQQLEYLKNWQINETIPQVLHESFGRAVREYVLVGGMPAVINAWRDSKSFIAVNQVQQDLLTTYRDDFAKYGTRIDKDRLDEIIQAVPAMLGEKFTYSKVNPNTHSPVIKKALELLVMARLVHKVYCTNASGPPIKAHINQKLFKTLFLDVGLASGLLKLSANSEMLAPNFALSNIGGISEQLVGQEILSLQPYFQDPETFYWAREQKNSSAEIDYLIQEESKIFPLEVKAGSTGTLRSLHLFMGMRSLNLGLRINSDLPSVASVNVSDGLGKTANYKLLSIPFYLVSRLPRLLRTLS